MLAVQLAVCAYPLVLLGFLMLTIRAELGSVPELAAVVFSAVALVAGLVGGLQFPLAVALHGQGERSAGALYGFDLFGSCLCAGRQFGDGAADWADGGVLGSQRPGRVGLDRPCGREAEALAP